MTFFSDRRSFLRGAVKAGMACSANSIFGRLLQAQESNPNGPSRILIDPRRTISPIDPNLFGSFLEHLGRAIYEGIYDPGNKLSDANGFRTDVLDDIKKLGVPIIRYPGGNFVSGYNWLDGVGPKKDRPVVLDKAWNSLESNQFGTNEFMSWCKLAGTKPLMGLNLGTGTPEQAAALVEYCNTDKGTEWSELRRKHGYADPYNVKHWCLGNEMDGPWQIGHMTAAEYGMKAQDAARQMRYVDHSVKLIVCGSSGPFMPTYLEWDREVLEQCYEWADGLSLHRYFGNTQEETGGSSEKFVALNLTMDKQIEETLAVCDLVRGHKRSPKQLWLSFDEWNVWYRERSGDAVDGHRKEAPHLLEEIYNLEDALLVGGLIITLLRHADRIKIACLAQLVNVIAPIMTNANGLFQQTIYYPYSWALQYAKGNVLEVMVQSPTYQVPEMDPVPYIDAAATVDANGQTSVFILNRDLSKPRQVELVWEDKAPSRVLTSLVLTGNDLKAVNGFDAPERVKPQPFEKPAAGKDRTTIEVPPRSYTLVQWAS
ncbi:MAG TPA: alpha-N-arabinofuranosidase [Terriglobales bacterium]|nr:alpha-N-arabinofuranosidase [Terriglobales bacterium]